jgi:diphosphomevalonate decarboxylase
MLSVRSGSLTEWSRPAVRGCGEEMKGLEPDRSTMLGAEITARANVNVALVKYWGKRDEALNLPATGSISLTLDGLWVEASCRFGVPADQCLIDGAAAADPDRGKVLRFVDLVRGQAGIEARAAVRTTSGVPAGVGLASSAAAFASLAVASSRAAGLRLEPPALSGLARRGSGSAARSIFGGFVEWRRGERPDGRDSIAEPLLARDAWDVRMVVAVTSTVRKAVSSRDGMRRAATSPLYPVWVETAERDLEDARKAIASRDLEALGLVAEHSALKMHAIGLGARPPLLYWRGSTVECVHRVWALREEGTPAWVTIDAGPQVKVLCAPADAPRVADVLRDVPGVERVLTCAPGAGAEVRA